MTRIMYVTDNNVNTTGGEQESTKILVHNVAERHSVAVVHPGITECETERLPDAIFSLGDSDRVKKMFLNPLQIPLYLLRLMRAIKSWKPDILHTQSQVAFFSLGLLKRMRLVPVNIKLIHTDRSIFTKYNRFYLGLFRFCLPSFDTMVLTTELNHQMWADYLAKQGVRKSLNIIYNTPGELFEVADEPSVHENGTAPSLTVGFAGRYCDWKNWPLAESIIAELEDRAPGRFKVAMAVGCLDEGAKRDASAMFKRVKDRLGERFDASINLPLSAMTHFYQQLDVLVVTSNPGAESFGRTVVEAMAKGCAVFTTDCGGPTEIIRNSRLVLRASDEFVNKIIELEQDSALLSSIREENLTIVKSHYTYQANVSKHIALYTSVMTE